MTMTAECARPAELGARIRERAAAILDLNQRRLSLDWLQEYPLPKLREACGRMAGEIPEDAAAGLHVQRELIRNPAFARYLARLLPLLPEEAPLEPPKPAAGRYGQPASKAAPSCGTGLMSWLDDFIKACQDNNKDPAGYELRDVAEVLGIEGLDGLGRLIYLENFAPRALDHEQRGRAINSLRQCVGVPAALTREQQDQLMEPYVPASSLFRGTAFSQVSFFAQSSPFMFRSSLPLIVTTALGISAGGYGAISSSTAARSVLCAVRRTKSPGTSRLQYPFGKMRFLGGCMLLLSLSACLTGHQSWSVIALCAIMFATGWLSVDVNIQTKTTLQLFVKPAFLGKVFGISTAISYVLIPLSLVLAGGLSEIWPAFVLPLASGGMLMMALVVLWGVERKDGNNQKKHVRISNQETPH